MNNLGELQPIIIIGMHRSGTSMLTNILQELNVFLGVNSEQNSESIPFLRLNEKILKLLDLKWNQVENAQSKIDINKNKLNKIVSSEINNKSFERDFLKYSNIRTISELNLFGWKDPRNTYTLPLYSTHFSNLKAIHIYRNPVDVSLSLSYREKKFDKSSRLSWFYHTRKFKLKNGFYVNRAPDLKNLEKGYSLWQSYVKTSLSYGDDVLHIKYEDLLMRPEFILNKIIKYLDIDLKNITKKNIISNINKERCYGFLNNEEGLNFYQKIKDDKLLFNLEYDNII